MTDRLDPSDHDWMRDPRALAVLDALQAAGGQGRYVGGCVRNALLGAPVDDVDIATTLAPGAVIEALRAAGLKAVPTGIDHGTVTAVSGGQPYEITTLRKDVETDGRRAVVAFTDDWREDASRRDFRLNAIYADRGGELLDYFGGIADARAGRIVFIGEAEQRIREDYLRIMRFYRFHAWHGRGAIDAEGQAACAALTEGLQTLSAERVWKELKKLFAAPDPADALAAMIEAEVLDALVPHADAGLLHAILVMGRHEPRARDPMVRLAALCGAQIERARDLARRMKVSKAERARLTRACGDPIPPGGEAEALHAALYRLGPQTVSDRLMLAAARGEGDPGALGADLGAAEVYQRPVFPLKAADLIAAGVARGPALGETLNRLEQDWIDSDFTLDRDGLLARL